MAGVHRVRPQAPAVDHPRLPDLRRQDPGAGARGGPIEAITSARTWTRSAPARGRGPLGSANDQQLPRADPRDPQASTAGLRALGERCRRRRAPTRTAVGRLRRPVRRGGGSADSGAVSSQDAALLRDRRVRGLAAWRATSAALARRRLRQAADPRPPLLCRAATRAHRSQAACAASRWSTRWHARSTS